MNRIHRTWVRDVSPHVLIVEDDPFVQALLGAYLGGNGFKTTLSASGQEMLAVLDSDSVDLIVLDLTLPDEDGLTLARQVRARSSVPIVVLTARKGRGDRLSALEMGVDDFITKPADPEELLLRLRNVLKRSINGDGAAVGTVRRAIGFGEWQLDLEAHSLTGADGRDIPLTRAEFNLIAALARAPNRVLSRDRLLDAIALNDEAPGERMIDVLISRLRKKIEVDARRPRWIITVPGCGYKFASGP